MKQAIYKVVSVMISAVLIVTVTGCNGKNGPWQWAKQISLVDLVSITQLDGGEIMSSDSWETLITLLNKLEKDNFSENKKLVGGTPEYGLVIETTNGTYSLNESIAPNGSLEMNYDGKQWWINDNSLSEFVSNCSTTKQ